MTDDLLALDALAQADLVRTGAVSPVELVDAAIARLEAVNPVLHAVIHERYERARAEAAGDLPAGPFRGVPILVKDLDGMMAGEPYHAGSEHLKRAGYVANADSWMLARMRAAGMVVLGRTNTPELGLVPTTEPVAHGPTRNPWDTTRTPGGSSGGSAAAVAARAVPLAHAGDGGGSIRIPASSCGLVGLLPSRGRTTLGPQAAEAWGGLARRHVVTRTVRDSAAALDVVHGWAPGDPYTAMPPLRPWLDEVTADPGPLRIGVLATPPDPRTVVAPECLVALRRAAALVESLGHHAVDQDRWLLDDHDQELFGANFGIVFAAFAAADVEELGRLAGTPATADTVEVGTWALAELGRSVTAVQYLTAREGLDLAARRIAGWWQDHDLLLTPTLPAPPPRLGHYDPAPGDPLAGMGRAAETVAFTVPFNITGQPAISVPLCRTDEGLPVGVQLVAAHGREDLLFAVAAQLEAAEPWAHHMPAL